MDRYLKKNMKTVKLLKMIFIVQKNKQFLKMIKLMADLVKKDKCLNKFVMMNQKTLNQNIKIP